MCNLLGGSRGETIQQLVVLVIHLKELHTVGKVLLGVYLIEVMMSMFNLVQRVVRLVVPVLLIVIPVVCLLMPLI